MKRFSKAILFSVLAIAMLAGATVAWAAPASSPQDASVLQVVVSEQTALPLGDRDTGL